MDTEFEHSISDGEWFFSDSDEETHCCCGSDLKRPKLQEKKEAEEEKPKSMGVSKSIVEASEKKEIEKKQAEDEEKLRAFRNHQKILYDHDQYLKRHMYLPLEKIKKKGGNIKDFRLIQYDRKNDFINDADDDNFDSDSDDPEGGNVGQRYARSYDKTNPLRDELMIYAKLATDSYNKDNSMEYRLLDVLTATIHLVHGSFYHMTLVVKLPNQAYSQFLYAEVYKGLLGELEVDLVCKPEER